MQRFEGKVVFITGGGAGLGRECALWWAEEGASVVVTDIVEPHALDVAAAITNKGFPALGMKVDVAKEAEVSSAVDRTVETYGRLDIMFANAGKPVAGLGSIPLEDITEEQWNDAVAVNLTGVFFCGKHAARVMKGQGGGNIVVTASAGGLTAYPNFGPYCSAKAGAIGLVRSMATDWGKYGIRVNALAPT